MPQSPFPISPTADEDVTQRQPADQPSWLVSLWRFCRPHTVIGTSLSVLSLFLIAGHTLGLEAGHQPQVWWVGLLAWIACIAGNVYIVGLNQLEDVAIDRINKPHLPLASGAFSRREALGIVGLSGALAIGLAASQGPFLLGTVLISLLIGTAYSLPPLRLKRFPFWASFCILAVRGVMVNLGLFLHFRDRFGLTLQIPPSVWSLTGFVLVFSVAIAIFKDIPDITGDQTYGIRTLTVRMGQVAVFKLARWVLTLCYGGMILVAPFLSDVNTPFLIGFHLGLLALFWWVSLRVTLPEQPTDTQRWTYPDLYQGIWKLFFLEYLLFPLAYFLA